MFIDLKKTLRAIDRCLPENRPPDMKHLHKMYDLVLRLMSQVLSVIYDQEAFSTSTGQEITPLAKQLGTGENAGRVVTLTIQGRCPP